MIDTDSELLARSRPHLARDRLLSAMRVVESLPPSARGALLVGPQEEPIGTILIEANRVCWGAALGMSGRLRDILRGHSTATLYEEEFEAIYLRCRRDGQPLGHALVGSGLLSAERMRAALKQHTIESLLAVDAAVADLCGSHTLEWPMQWIAHAGVGYNPSYTFGAVEVLSAAGVHRLDVADAELMTNHLENLADDDNAVAACSFQPDGTPLFVCASTRLPLDLSDLVEVTTWADAALGASPGFSPQVAHACVRSAGGGAVAWRYEGQCCVAVCLDGAALQRLTRSLSEQSLAMVLVTRTAVLDRVRARIRGVEAGEVSQACQQGE